MIIEKANRLNSVKEYYFVRKLEEIAKLNKEGKRVINFGIGSPDLAPSEATVAALSETSKRPDAHGYQSYRGLPEFREAISNYYQRTYGVGINPATEILPLLGSKEGILHLSMAFLNPGDEALVPDPGYPAYTSLTTLVGGKVRLYDLKEKNGWHPDFKELQQQDLSKVKMMWVNYAHMPTGTPATREVLEQLVAFARRNNILICYDNPYSLVLNIEAALSLLAIPGAKEVAIELNSFSKSHNMAGWRVGMMLGEEGYLNAALAVKSNIDSGMFLGTQKAAMEALNNSDSWHAKRNRTYHERRQLIFKILDLLKFEYNPDQVGLFVWAKPKAEANIEDIPAFVDKLLYSVYIFFTPGIIFGKNGTNYMRVSLCMPLEKIEEAYQRLIIARGTS